MTIEPAEDLSTRQRPAAAGELADLLDFFENGPVAVHWLAADGTILRANRAELDLLGYDRDEYVGHNIREFHADNAAIEQMLARLPAGDTVRDYEARLRCNDGSVKHVLIDCNVLRRDGEFVHTRCVTRDNSALKQLEDRFAWSCLELERSLDELATLYNLAPMGIAIAPDPDCQRIEVNPALAEILQLPNGANASLSAPPGEKPSYRVLRGGREVPSGDLPLQQAAREGANVPTAEYEILRADGTARTVYGFASPLLDKDGTVRGSVGAFIDITERKAAELRLVETESRARAVLETAVDAIITIDASGTIESVNPATERLFGYSASEIVGRDISVLMPSPYREEHAGYIANYLDTGVPRIIGTGRRVEGRRKDGTTFAMHLAVSEVKLGPRRLFTGIVHDISEAKLIEDALRASEHRYRTLAETIPALITLSNTEGQIEYCNARVLEYTGMTFEQLRDGWYTICHPDDLEQHREEWLAAMRWGQPITTEFRARRHDGVYRWHLGRLTFIRNDAGRITGWIGAHVDIDDQERMLAELQDALAVKDEFLGLVSHELKTPITTILGNAQILHRIQYLDEAERRAALADIAGEAERLHRIIDNMLVLARLQSGSVLDAEPLQLRRVIEALADQHRQRHPSRRLELRIEPELPIVAAEPGYLDQVLRNLLSNAEKYSPQDQPITIAARGDGEEVLVSVLDRGPGISPAEADALFTPFYRSPNTAGTVQGMGIGLTVCSRLVEALAGRMWARARDGGGSDVGFALPIEDADGMEA